MPSSKKRIKRVRFSRKSCGTKSNKMKKHSKKHSKKTNRRKSKRGGCSCLFSGGKPQKGGYVPAQVPPLVGTPWTPDNLPGQQGIQGVTNHFSLNKYIVDPQTAMVSTRNYEDISTQDGGGKGRGRGRKHRRHIHQTKRKYRKIRGGSGLTSLMPSVVLNIGDNLKYGVTSAYGSLNGDTPGPSPLPYDQPALSKSPTLL